jgi:hypothetical protein
MHEFPCKPPDYGLSRGTPLFPFRPTEKHRSHSLQRKAFICELAGSICELAGSAVWLRSLRCTVRAIAAVAPFVCQIAVSALFMPSVRAQTVSQNRRADGIRAMPSARALLVASLLTEPPYGRLGPSGNDRYRKRSLRSQTAGASQVNCQVAAAHSQ